MRNTVDIENIEDLRRQEGIDDVELWEEINALKIGDCVRITLLTGSSSFESVLVRIVRIKGSAFLGDLVTRPSSPTLSELQAGSSISFKADHIHSIPKGRPVPA